MADKEEAVDEKATTTRGNDWEVVSLTASAYAASPGPKEPKDDETEAETSHPLYMSRHFILEEDDDKASKKKKVEEEDFGFSVEQQEQETGKEDGDLMNLKGLNLSDDFTYFKEKDKKENIYNERALGGSHVYEQNEAIHEPIEPVTVVAVVSPTKSEKKKKDEEEANVDNVNVPPPSLPCEAWWKRSAASLISQAKETNNTVWSIFVAAAVMGIVILGQRWQHERWQILQVKWESSIGNEKAGRLIGPISRLKQAFIGGQRRDSFIRVSSQNDG